MDAMFRILQVFLGENRICNLPERLYDYQLFAVTTVDWATFRMSKKTVEEHAYFTVSSLERVHYSPRNLEYHGLIKSVPSNALRVRFTEPIWISSVPDYLVSLTLSGDFEEYRFTPIFPSRLRELVIGTIKGEILEKLDFPAGLRELKVRLVYHLRGKKERGQRVFRINGLKDGLQKLVLLRVTGCDVLVEGFPQSLGWLRLPIGSVQPVANRLPPALHYLRMCNALPDGGEGLPKGIAYLRLGDDFNSPIDRLPSSLKTLVVGDFYYSSSFDQPLDSLPPGLKILRIYGCRFNRPLDRLPHGLRELVIGGGFDQPLGSLPSGLELLALGVGFSGDIANIPVALKTLCVHERYLESPKGKQLLTSLLHAGWELGYTYEWFGPWQKCMMRCHQNNRHAVSFDRDEPFQRLP